MALTLTSDIAATARTISVTGTVPDVIGPGYAFRLDDELLMIFAFEFHDVSHTLYRQWEPNRNVWMVRRGQGGSVVAPHTAGTTIFGASDAFTASGTPSTPIVFPEGGPGGGSALEVLDEGVSLDSAVTSIDVVGTGVTATNVGHAVTLTVAGGGGGTPTLADVLVAGNTADMPILFSGGGVLDGSGSIYMEADAAENGEKGSLELNGIVARITGGFTSGIGNGARFTAGGASGSQAGTAALRGGNAAGASDDAGGDITLTPGAGDGAGRNGQVVAVLPTADPSVTNAIWSDGGTLVLSGSTAGGVTPATDPGDIADPTIATAEDVANAYNTLLANLRAEGLIA